MCEGREYGSFCHTLDVDIALSGNQKYPSIFSSKKLHKFYMFADIGDTGRDDEDDIALSDNKESLAEDTDMTVNG